MTLGEHDHIITAFAERAAGPGWSNQPLWVIVRSRLDGTLRQECIQPEEQTAEIVALFNISEAAHQAMVSAVRSAVKPRARRRTRATP